MPPPQSLFARSGPPQRPRRRWTARISFVASRRAECTHNLCQERHWKKGRSWDGVLREPGYCIARRDGLGSGGPSGLDQILSLYEKVRWRGSRRVAANEASLPLDARPHHRVLEAALVIRPPARESEVPLGSDPPNSARAWKSWWLRIILIEGRRRTLGRPDPRRSSSEGEWESVSACVGSAPWISIESQTTWGACGAEVRRGRPSGNTRPDSAIKDLGRPPIIWSGLFDRPHSFPRGDHISSSHSSPPVAGSFPEASQSAISHLDGLAVSQEVRAWSRPVLPTWSRF